MDAGTPHPHPMNKRNLAAFLWFLVGWQAGGVLVGLVALPGILAFAPGVVMAVLVLWDPTGLFVARKPKGRQVTPINEYAAALDRRQDRHLDKRVEQWPAVEADNNSV
jgi:hypothetical protein